MKKLIIPIVMGLFGGGAGTAAGIFLKPAATDHAAPDEHAAPADEHAEEGHDTGVEYAKLNNQFVVPVIHDGKMDALVITSLSVAVPTGQKQAVFEAEPKLRDSFFSALLAHANIGGFDGMFTETERMDSLRRALLESATALPDLGITEVLIVEIARQDVT